MEVIGVMLVKSDSKRLPGKNTMMFNWKPMFIHNLAKCLEVFDKTIVSTDSEEIAQAAIAEGAGALIRDKALCGDTPSIVVFEDIANRVDFDAMVSVQANSPTIDIEVIRIIKLAIETGRYQEIKTIHPNGSDYGSAWAFTQEAIHDTYSGSRESRSELNCIVDDSIDIHTMEDFNRARRQDKRNIHERQSTNHRRDRP